MPKQRDFQRQRVFDAENAHSLHQANKMEFLIDCQVWLNKITHSRWMKNRYPLVQRTKVTNGRVTAYSSRYELFLPLWARTPLIMLHELTHTIITNYLDPVPWHGTTFCKVFLSLIKQFLGQEAWVEMKELFINHKVRWVVTEKRK